MKNQLYLVILLAGMLSFNSCIKKNENPNVVIIYTDDIGYGDVGCYGAKLIETPNIDQLASEGIRFTDGHCAASTCSPSRYSLLTGEMGFRKNVGIQPVNAKLCINPSQFTMGKLFQQAGYKTGIIGKWHLGLGDGNMDWNGEIKPGPNELGFDYSFIIPSSNDRSPFVFVENHEVYNYDPNDPITVSRERIPDSIPGTQYPDALLNPESVTVYKGDRDHVCSVINGVGRIGYMKGGKKALWIDNDIADNLVDKAKAYIDANKENPFLLLMTTNDIHAPRLPHPRFTGSTSLGYRGDNVVQLDWCVGEIMKNLEENGLEENTILMFASDNGPVYIDGGYQDGSGKTSQQHKAAGIYRGGKYQIYEGGTRTPLIIRWPSKIKPQVSDALVSQVDLLASFASFFNVDIPGNAAPDSRNYWDAFMGNDKVGAKVILEQTNTDAAVAIRKGNQKCVSWKNGTFECYDLENDPSEKVNLIDQKTEWVERLIKDIKALRETHLNEYYKE